MKRKNHYLCLYFLLLLLPACSNEQAEQAIVPIVPEEPEAIARTEFTERVEDFFEYEPLKAGQPSQFRIHLTDLSDGTPVEKANVTLTVRAPGSTETVAEIKALVGKVTGIYVAEVAIPRPGTYDIEFRITNTKLNERLALSNFQVE